MARRRSPPKKKIGRPTSRTPEVENAIGKALRMGRGYKGAAAAAGIHLDTLNEWRRRDPKFAAWCAGEKEKGVQGVMSRIYLALDRAKPGCSTEDMRLGLDAAKWLASRLDPERLASPDKLLDRLTAEADQQVDDGEEPPLQYL